MLRNIWRSIYISPFCIIQTLIFLSAFDSKLAFANCNLFGCSDSILAACNPFGCPNSPMGESCTLFGCPPSLQPSNTSPLEQQQQQQQSGSGQQQQQHQQILEETTTSTSTSNP